jgi:1,4-alpha-glucan branching enzyme
MISRRRDKDGRVRVTFALKEDRWVSLVGDHNDWDPHAHPLVRRANGTRSVALVVPEGTRIRFRYLADGGEFFDDPDAEVEDNGMGGTHGVVTA